MNSPEDIQEIGFLLDQLDPSRLRRLAILAKVEGTATTNDFSRSLCMRALHEALDARGLGSEGAVQVILSMGCEGVISPGGYLFAADREMSGGLEIGLGRSPVLSPRDLLSASHIEHARLAVVAAMDDAALAPEDVALVFMKSPLLTHQEAVGLPKEQVRWAGISSASRGVAALGIGKALGEISAADASIANLLVRDDVYTRRGMVFSGTETRRCEAIVLGRKRGVAAGALDLRSGMLSDIVDIEGMARVVAPGSAEPISDAVKAAASGGVIAAFFKAGVSRSGTVRGRRTTVFSSDLDPDKHMRAAASGVLAALLGDCRMFVSGGSEHQAPDGGALFAVITGS